MTILSKLTPLAMLLALVATPALADHDHNGHDNDYRNGRGNYDNHGRGHAYGHNKNWHNNARYDNNNWQNNNSKYAKEQRKQARKFKDWNDERLSYRSNWDRMSPAQRTALNAQLQTQWQAYHHNQWNGGPTTWNNYNDPQFLDYLHTSNPGVLTTIRNYLNF